MNEDEMIMLQDEDGNEVPFLVLEQTKINGKNYLLVADSEDDEAEALILEELTGENDEEIVYRPVEDDAELDYLSRIFAELLDDVEFA